ncbi:MAG: hypothetical protein R3281_13500, partial [Balneolaceae bacterium]|nr:hypothetical protein [Balneolaceae bacterium]
TDLPLEAQFSSIQDFITTDLNNDGNLDLILGGNLFESEPEIPRNDASNGLVLTGEGDGRFAVISPFESGFLAPLNVKKMALLERSGQLLVVVANNDGPLQLFSVSGDKLPYTSQNH